MKQQQVVHLRGGLLALHALGDGAPELVETRWPVAAVALLTQREWACERAGLAPEQIQVVLQLCAGAMPAGQPLSSS